MLGLVQNEQALFVFIVFLLSNITCICWQSKIFIG